MNVEYEITPDGKKPKVYDPQDDKGLWGWIKWKWYYYFGEIFL